MNLDLFLTIFYKISSLYLVLITGYIAGRFVKIKYEGVVQLVFFILNPIVIFSGLMNASIDGKMLALPLLVYLISTVLCISVYKLTPLLFKDHSRNILAYSSGSSSTAQFGLPVVLMLFDIGTVGIYTIAFIGVTLFENTIGFYIAAKGHFSSFQCIKRLIKLPNLHAILLGIICQRLHINTSNTIDAFFYDIRITYVVLGMMTIGMSVANIKKLEFDWKFMVVSFGVKYLVWPLIMISLVFIDENYLFFYDSDTHIALLVLSIVPLSVSTAVIASILNYPAERFSVVVLINILMALVYVPSMIVLLGIY